MALKQTAIDTASFTAIRLVSGALVLWIIVCLRSGTSIGKDGNWPSALALFAYAAGFSFAYVSLPTATGALLLFGAVQVTMIDHGIKAGDRLQARQSCGLVLAFAGLVGLLLPGITAPSGRRIADAGCRRDMGHLFPSRLGYGCPTGITAGNFLRAAPIALLLVLPLSLSSVVTVDPIGVAYAIASGALASGIGYSIWYSALQSLKATTAATVQLGVPVIAAIDGAVLLAEPVTLRPVLASITVLGGIALVIANKWAEQA